ncbi:hypothetical protein BC826DRAFT_942184 [Russula brevipes]|nr:hypothetical protein BC826DRAFT_942184 [Russula brevipes]
MLLKRGAPPVAQHSDGQASSHRTSRKRLHYILQLISRRELGWMNTILLLTCILVLFNVLIDIDRSEIVLLLVAIFS